MSQSAAPAGVNMPKKRDPRLRRVQQPPSKQFFDSADYEVRKQEQQKGEQQQSVQQQSVQLPQKLQPGVASSKKLTLHSPPL